LAFAGSFHEVVGLGFHPSHKIRHVRVRQKRVDRIELSCQFCFREQGMNLAVTDTVQVLGVATPFGLRHKVMCIALAGWNRAITQWANKVYLCD